MSQEELAEWNRRIEALDWAGMSRQLNEQGWAVTPALLNQEECIALRQLFAQDDCFRTTTVMSQHGFGRGVYRYFSYPLPKTVQALRASLYAQLVPIANAWHTQLREALQFPLSHQTFVKWCHEKGQCRPTPLMLSYEQGDYNRLHQDRYGEYLFPLQAVLLLSQPGDEFTGGELVITEQRARMQSRPMVVPLNRGDLAIFGGLSRPVQGSRGYVRANLRHGVSALSSGQRMTLGIIFHDAT